MDIDRYGTLIGFNGGYQKALQDIMNIIYNSPDNNEAVFEIWKFVMEYKQKNNEM